MAIQSDIYERITNQIVSALESGVKAGNWECPWARGQAIESPTNIASKKYYRGVNVLALWAAAYCENYKSGVWGTYAQWQEKGCQVRKGEKATQIVFWKEISHENDEGEATTHMMARGYCVFNADQVDGYTAPELAEITPAERIEAADGWFAGIGSRVTFGGNRAFYQPSADTIQMPDFDLFRDSVSFYSTLAHEHIHWTGAEKRMNRDMSGRFGSESYAMEELVAELGAAFTCARLGLAAEPRADHAQYIASWLKVLKGDKRAIFTAASHAQKAADFLAGLAETEEAIAA